MPKVFSPDLHAVSTTVSFDQLKVELERLEVDAKKEISEAADFDSLEKLRVGLLGKKGRLSLVLGSMGKLPAEDRPRIGQRANVLKSQVQESVSERLELIKTKALSDLVGSETIDVTAPPIGTPIGRLRGLSRFTLIAL